MPQCHPVLAALRRYKLLRARALGVTLFARLTGVALLVLCALLWADRVFVLGRAARTAMAAAALAGGLAAFARALYRGLKLLSDEAVALAVSERIPALCNYLATACSLLKNGAGAASAELANGHIAATESILKQRGAVTVFPVRFTRGTAVLLLCGFAAAALSAPAVISDPQRMARVFFPFKTIPAETCFDIRPGDITVPRGGSVIVTAADRTESGRVPTLELKAVSGPWFAGNLTPGGTGYAASLDKITEPVYYRVRWQDLVSRTYLITPRDYPALTGIGVHVAPPAYSGRAAYGVSPELGGTALRGSRVTVSGKAAEPLGTAELMLAAADERARPKPSVLMTKGLGGLYFGSFVLEGDTEFWFRLVSTDSWADPAPLKYTLHAEKDNPPAAALLAPAYETEAAPGDALAIVYEAADDTGLSALSLDYKTVVNGAPAPALSGSRKIREYALPGPLRQLGDTSLSLFGYPDGALVTVTLTARDGAGQSAESAPAVITVRDYSAQHSRAEIAMLQTERGLRALARAYEEQAERLAQSSSAFSAEQDQRLARQWRELASGFDELRSAAANDAYLNEGVRQELDSLAARQEYMRKNDAETFSREARAGDEQAPQTARELGRELERMAKAVEEQRKFQFFKDFESASYSMADTQDSIENTLKDFLKNGGKGATEAEWRQLEQNIASIARQLDELKSLISELPDPREIKGQDERKMHYIPVSKSQDLAERLMQAIKNRDFKKAAELAAELSEQLARMRKTFSEAAEEQLASGSDGKAKAELDKLQARLDDLAERQAKSLSQTQSVAEAQAARRADVQRAMIESLAARQAALALRAAPYAGYIRQPTLAAMKFLPQHIRARQIEPAKKVFSEIKTGLYAVESATPSVSAALTDIRTEQDAIGAELEKLVRPPVPPTEREQGVLGENAARQRGIREETDGLGSAARRAAQEDGLQLPPGFEKKLGAASVEMTGAEGSLTARDADTASDAQARALKLLEESRDQMEQSRQSMSQKRGGYQSSARRQSGRQGRETGRAKLPSSEDYLPPAAIRERAMQSMREAYPAERGEVIKEYLRKLAQ